MRRDGIRNYSIYRHGLTALRLSRARRAAAPEGQPTDPIVWRWWEMMAPYMETNPDFSPVQEPVEEMFHAD